MSYHAEITESSCDNFQDSIESLKRKEQNGVLLLKNKVNVFDRIEIESPGARMCTNIYNLVIGLVLCWGMLINWLGAKNLHDAAPAKIDPLLFIAACLGTCCLGVVLFEKSTQPLLSFLGYNFVVVSIGLVISFLAYPYDPSLIPDTLRIVVLVTITMTGFSVLFPKYFEKFFGALFIAILAVIIVAAIEIMLLNKHHHIIDLLAVLVFCGYIGIDWGRANRIPKTLPNAVDSAAAVYMDIINLFPRLLRIPLKRRDL